jgi:long-chain acyl-CoA synthetase
MAIHVENLAQLQRDAARTYADRPCLGTRKEGRWVWRTYREMGELVDACRAGLAALGVREGDIVAIVSNNRLEWAVACYATYGLKAVFVPMYEAQRPKEWRFILEDCGAKVAFAATREIYGELQGMVEELPTLEHVVGLELGDDHEDAWTRLLARGKSEPVPVAEPDPGTVAGFIYTSGTTGKPKGVVLTHANIASNINGMIEVFPVSPDDRSLSFLPWAHSFGQVVELHQGLASGCSSAINDDITRLIDNLADVKPTILIAVPRIFNKIYDGVHRQIEGKPRLLQRLFEDGIRAASRRSHGERISRVERLELAVDDKIIFSKIRDKFGGRLKFVISGSAALSPDVAEFIDALGIEVYEGYGLSETSPAVTSNTPGNRKIGSVGRPLPGVQVTIDTSVTDDPEEGEIVVHGPNVMKGYHHRPEQTAEVLTEDGGLRTGDLGYLDGDGYLYVTGRIKELYKLETGKYVSPAPLEEELQLSPFIANALVYGDNRPYNVALIVPDRALLEEWAEERGVELGRVSDNEAVLRLIEDEVRAHSSSFKSFEIPKRIALVDDDFTVDNGLLTPTLKLKRRIVIDRFGDTIEQLYAEGEQSPARARAGA